MSSDTAHGSRAIGPDEQTLGGIPSAEARRASRSIDRPAERPTQPILHAAGEMPGAAPAPDVPPPDRQRALDLARSYLSGPCAQKVVGRDGCEEMARWIVLQPDLTEEIRVVDLALAQLDRQPPLTRAEFLQAIVSEVLVARSERRSSQPDYVAAIDEWLVATVAVERMQASGEIPSPVALSRMDDGERALAALSSLDRRFAGTLDAVLDAIRNRRSLGDVLEFDAPTPGNVTDHEILALARSCGDGTATDALSRGTCILALGIGGPIPPGIALVRGQTREEMVAKARAWCAAKIHERSQTAALDADADPDPIDGPERHRPSGPLPVPTCPERNRSRLARENAGLSIRLAARRLGIEASDLAMIEAGQSIAGYLPGAPYRRDTATAMASLYQVGRAWLIGEVPLRDYARIDAMRGSYKLSPGDRDTIAELAASLPTDSERDRSDRPTTPAEALDDIEVLEASIVKRIWTPRDDGTCAVCGGPPRVHNERPGQLGACPAVAP